MKITLSNYISKLKDGKTLLYPTDTIWGLGCDATNQEAVNRIFALKNRPLKKPLIALVADIEMLSRYVNNLPKNIEKILKTDQPTTIVYPQGLGLASSVIGENGSVAIRIPKSCFALDLVKAFGKPIVSTSANISNKPIPETFDEIDPYILEHVDEIVPLEKDKVARIPSMILQLKQDGNVIKLR